jgi:hypothetical protein
LANGDLLRIAEEAGFDVLLTADNNLAYQQNLKGRNIAILASSVETGAFGSAGDPENCRGGQQCGAGKLSGDRSGRPVIWPSQAGRALARSSRPRERGPFR